MKPFKTLSFTLIALVILLSGVSILNAAGTWKNPTASAPGNNTDAPINVGTEAQDKAGVLRVTGFRSFFDAIFDTKVQIGTTGSMPTNLTLLSNGKVGAEAYCDRQGNNCVTSSGISVTNSSSTSSSVGPGMPAPSYDSGWINYNDPRGDSSINYPGGKKYTLTHNLGTADTFNDVQCKFGPNGYSYSYTSRGGNTQVSGDKPNNYYSGFYYFWANETPTTIQIFNLTAGEDSFCSQIRLRMWKINS